MAAGLHRPGVYISEVPTQTVALPDSPDTSIAAFVEQAYKGPSLGGIGVPTVISSWNQFVNLFGGFADVTKLLPFAVFEFFNNGGAQCIVERVLGASPVAAAATLRDQAATPQNTLTVTADNEGVWGNSVSVQIVARGVDRFDIVVYLGTVNDAHVVERLIDLSMITTDPRYVLAVVNNTFTGSDYITVADLNSATTAPADRPAFTTTALTGGNDGSVAGTSDYAAAVATLDQFSQALLINIPGQTSSNIIGAAIAYTEGRADSFLVIDPSPGLTVAAAISEQGALVQSSYAGYFYPWLQAIDPSSTARGAIKNLPPGGSVMGLMINTDLRFGPYKAAAGLGARIQGAVNIERPLSAGDRDSLNDNNVNAIRLHPTGGIVVFGNRTLSRTAATRYIAVRRNLNYMKDNIKKLVEFAIFENNDPTTWSLCAQRVTQFLTTWWQAGGLRGASTQEAFFVVCDDTNNNATTIDAGELHIDVGAAVEEPAEFIVINIGQWQGGQSAIEA